MLKYLLEIRNKFILLAITFVSTLVVCYYYKEVLLFLVTQMHLNSEGLYFIFTDVTELVSVYFRLILFISLQSSLWYSFFHLFSFISTALHIQEFKFMSFLFNGGTFFLFLSCLLSSYVLIPFGWNFFLSFHSQHGFYFEARINEYLNFYVNIYSLCLLYCELFTILFFFLIDVQQNYSYIKKYRKLYYYIFLIFATLITPPDLITQISTTFLVILIYEILLFLTIINFCIRQFNLEAS